MLFQRFEDQGLAHYSYVVGCPESGELAVVDPSRDVDTYLDFAAARGLVIRSVLETHIHADFASGARELAAESGAELWLSAYDEGEAYEVEFPHRQLREGDAVEVGEIRLEALYTPGHTPEHLCYLVFDPRRSADAPLLFLSGDFLFVGSLGRPDLLGEEAKLGLARSLFASVRSKLPGLPDDLAVHPAHGAGSMCGSGMSGQPSSTLGTERRTNPYLDPALTEGEFVERILAQVPPFPPYYRRMKRLNSQGPPILGGLPGGSAMPAPEFRKRLEEGWLAIDVRDHRAFGRGHVPGSLGIGAGPNLSTWAAWVVPYEVPLLLVASDAAAVEGAVRSLVRVGLDDVRGTLEGGVEAWSAAGYELRQLPQWAPRELDRELGGGDGPTVLDVRTDEEWASGHIPGATQIMGGFLEERLAELPGPEETVAVVCRTGYRSTVAASLLERRGYRRLVHLQGGMSAWNREGLPVVREDG